MLNRNDACAILRDNNITPSLITHALATEAVMGALADRLGEDRNLWAMTGLLHDVDYPLTTQTPERHGVEAASMLSGKMPEEAIQAIKRHNAEMNGNMPETKFDFALRCGETVTGLIHAASLMRPDGYAGMQVKSIKKKMKDKAFAANVNREIIRECEKAGLDLDEFLALSINAMSQMNNELES